MVESRLFSILALKKSPIFTRMRKYSAALCFYCLLSGFPRLWGQNGVSLTERLGHPAGSKLLIIHADDLAVAHAENSASFKSLETGLVNSASIMVPCPWLPEVAEYAKKHPNHDLGLHLTFSSEWKHYKWGPVAPLGEVGSLVDANGYFYDNCADFAAKAKPAEVERELRAQIEQARSMGIEPTHLDSHMGCLFQNPALLEIYLKMGRAYGITPMISREDIVERVPEPARSQLFKENDRIVDRIVTAAPEDYKKGMEQYYTNLLQNLKPGVNVLLIHTAFNDAEMQGVTVDHPDWGAAWRQADFDFFNSKKCRKLLKKQGIKLVTWREIGKAK
jgi:chitin disaccharide deacetylase